MTGKEIITKFHSIGDAELSLADTQWLIRNIDEAINKAKTPVMPKIAEIPKNKLLLETVFVNRNNKWECEYDNHCIDEPIPLQELEVDARNFINGTRIEVYVPQQLNKGGLFNGFPKSQI